MEWSLVGLPIPGMNVNRSTGLLSWAYPMPKSDFYLIEVQATNDLSRSSPVLLLLHVSPSYYVTVSTNNASNTRPSSAFYFDLVTRDLNTMETVGNKFAVFWIYEKGTTSSQRREMTVKTDAFGRFQHVYQPYSTDAGIFFYGGEHQHYYNLTVQGHISIKGIEVYPLFYYFRGFALERQEIANVFTIEFKGGEFSGIVSSFETTSEISVISSISSNTTNPQNSTIIMSLQIYPTIAVRDRIYFTLSTNEGLMISSSFVYLDVRYRTPQIAVIPFAIDVMAESGGNPSYHNVMIQNIGSLKSSPIKIIFPAQDVITPMAEYISCLAVDETVVVSFRVFVKDDVPIGTVHLGTIGFASNTSDTAALDYRITVVSSTSTVLTVITQNEASFFSDNKPNLGFVDVRVLSMTTGIVFNENTGENGTIILNLMEDIYEITAQKASHSTFRRTVFLRTPGQTVEAFLQFDAVSYTFTVITVPVTDKYEIIVETTFTTGMLLRLLLF